MVLKLAEKAGLAKLGHVALDGTKIKANALQTQGDELRTHEDACRRSFAPKWTAGLKLRKQPTRKRTNSTAQAVAATKCPAGSLTNRSAWPKSARPGEALEAEAAAAAAAKAEAERAAEEKRARRGEPQALGAGSSPALKRARSQGAAQLYPIPTAACS